MSAGPVAVLGSVAAGALVISNGLPALTPDEFDWIGPAVGLVGLAITAGVTFWTRSQVTPVANVAAQVLPSGQVVAGDATDIPTGAPVEVTPTTAGDY
jgi:hypothetical protein